MPVYNSTKEYFEACFPLLVEHMETNTSSYMWKLIRDNKSF